MDYLKDFDGWIEKKKEADAKTSRAPYFKERDIWWVSVGVNVGFEEDGKNGNYVRPVLVVKKFNQELFVGLPMSTKLKNNKYYLPVSMQGREVSVLVSQLRVFSSKRIWNKLGELDTTDFMKVVTYLREKILPPLARGRG